MSIAGRNKKRFSSLCKGEELRSHCRKSEGAYWADVRNVKPATNLELHIARDAGDEILAEMKASSPDIYNSQKDARSAFEYLRHLDARNVLAFRETWTSEDTNMLLKLDKFPNGWTQGDFSEEKFRSYLPSIKVLEEAINRGPMALVGSGPSVAGNGGMIDLHPVIVRFNNHVGNELKFHDTGRKMTMHVINGHIDFYNERDVLHLDLEGTTPGASMCKRWHQSEARKTGVPEDQLTIMFRPSAVCGIPGTLNSFTRGFLFYWLVGRLAKKVDMYGMSAEDGKNHYAPTLEVSEPFLAFEHALYKAAQTVRARAIEVARNKTAQEAAKAAAAERAKQAAIQAVVDATRNASLKQAEMRAIKMASLNVSNATGANSTTSSNSSRNSTAEKQNISVHEASGAPNATSNATATSNETSSKAPSNEGNSTPEVEEPKEVPHSSAGQARCSVAALLATSMLWLLRSSPVW